MSQSMMSPHGYNTATTAFIKVFSMPSLAFSIDPSNFVTSYILEAPILCNYQLLCLFVRNNGDMVKKIDKTE